MVNMFRFHHVMLLGKAASHTVLLSDPFAAQPAMEESLLRAFGRRVLLESFTGTIFSDAGFANCHLTHDQGRLGIKSR